jgi:ankyrin repeat protein/class 3 adenylate cyclase
MAINIFTHIKRGLFDNVYNCIEKDKVDVNQRDDDTGNPPLVVAVEENQIEIVKLLLNRGADVNVKDWTSKNTALDISEQKGFKPISELLQQRGAKYSSGSSFHLAAKNGDIVSIEEMLSKKQDINEVDAGKGWTALHYAVNYGQKHLVEYLIIKGADVNKKDFLGKNNPIDVLSNVNRGEIVKLLNKNGAKSSGGVNIHFCAETGDFEGVQSFYDKDGKINGRDEKNGWMPLHYAVNANDVDMVEFLVHLGANVNGADFKGETAPLDIAFKTGNVEMQSYLQAKGALRKKKHDIGGGGKDVNIYITDEVKKQIALFIEKRNREEAAIKKHEEEQTAKEPKKKDAPVKKINWKDFLKLKNMPIVEKKVEEPKKVEIVKPIKQIVNTVEKVDVEAKSSRLQLDVEQDGFIFFMDIVAYSKKTTDEQKKACKDLGVLVKATMQYKTANALEKLIILPTGDGMVMGFFTYLEDAMNCAIAIAKAVKDRPDLQMRMGVHCGPVIPMEDINGNLNISGDGINYAQRVMDAGETNHLLVSSDVMLKYDRPAYVLVSDLGDVVVKHGVVMHLYSLHGSDFGNKAFPSSRVKKAEPTTNKPV